GRPIPQKSVKRRAEAKLVEGREAYKIPAVTRPLLRTVLHSSHAIRHADTVARSGFDNHPGDLPASKNLLVLDSPFPVYALSSVVAQLLFSAPGRIDQPSTSTEKAAAEAQTQCHPDHSRHHACRPHGVSRIGSWPNSESRCVSETGDCVLARLLARSADHRVPRNDPDGDLSAVQ